MRRIPLPPLMLAVGSLCAVASSQDRPEAPSSPAAADLLGSDWKTRCLAAHAMVGAESIDVVAVLSILTDEAAGEYFEVPSRWNSNQWSPPDRAAWHELLRETPQVHATGRGLHGLAGAGRDRYPGLPSPSDSSQDLAAWVLAERSRLGSTGAETDRLLVIETALAQIDSEADWQAERRAIRLLGYYDPPSLEAMLVPDTNFSPIADALQRTAEGIAILDRAARSDSPKLRSAALTRLPVEQVLADEQLRANVVASFLDPDQPYSRLASLVLGMGDDLIPQLVADYLVESEHSPREFYFGSADRILRKHLLSQR